MVQRLTLHLSLGLRSTLQVLVAGLQQTSWVMQHMKSSDLSLLSMHRADSIGTSSGFLKARGSVDFATINILTATPNLFNVKQAPVSGGGLGLLPWYIHPASADIAVTHAVTMGNMTAAPGTVSDLSVPTSPSTATGALVPAPSASPAQTLSAMTPGALPTAAVASG